MMPAFAEEDRHQGSYGDGQALHPVLPVPRQDLRNPRLVAREDASSRNVGTVAILGTCRRKSSGTPAMGRPRPGAGRGKPRPGGGQESARAFPAQGIARPREWRRLAPRSAWWRHRCRDGTEAGNLRASPTASRRLRQVPPESRSGRQVQKNWAAPEASGTAP